MLAEPKSRSVFTLNPRGKFWSEDTNKLGQKLLESMGWEKGKGLGKHENGIKEHIRVEFKSDNKGLGFKPTADDQWMVNNSDYEDILAQLALHHNNGSNVETKVSNLEEKSKNIRNRVHYHKFIRAKNLSQCTQKDLSSIFPKKRENSVNENKCLNKSVNTKSPTIEDSLVDNTFESTTNINDYFKSKMDKLKIKSKLIDKNDSTQSKCEETSINNVVSVTEISIDEEKTVILDDEWDHLAQNKSNQYKKVKKSKANLEQTNEDIEKLDLIVNKIESKKNKRKKDSYNCSTSEKELDSKIDNNFSDESIIKLKKSKKSKRQKKIDNKSQCFNDSKEIEKQIVSESDSNETSVENSSLNKSMTKLSKKSKYEIRLPKGYDKHSANGSLKNYYKICEAIAKDKTLNTTNLISLHGYGYESD